MGNSAVWSDKKYSRCASWREKGETQGEWRWFGRATGGSNIRKLRI